MPDSNASSASSPSNAKNILTSDVDIKGTVKFENELIFDGKIEGEIISDGTLTLGKNAHVQGEVRTKAVTVHGTVVGNITVTEKCELKASSQLTGDLRATRILIEEGATFVGKSEVTPGKAVTREATTGRSSSSTSSTSSSGSSSASGSSNSSNSSNSSPASTSNDTAASEHPRSKAHSAAASAQS